MVKLMAFGTTILEQQMRSFQGLRASFSSALRASLVSAEIKRMGAGLGISNLLPATDIFRS
jgi:hypothetical protein